MEATQTAPPYKETRMRYKVIFVCIAFLLSAVAGAFALSLPAVALGEDENTAPALADDIENPASTSIEAGITSYSPMLSNKFVDADGDTLIYEMRHKLDDGAFGDWIALPTHSMLPVDMYTIVHDDPGLYTYEFRAFDGIDYSPTYTVKLTAHDPTTKEYTFTMYVSPSTANIQLYKTIDINEAGYDSFDETAPLEITDNGVVPHPKRSNINVHSYTVTAPLGTYSYRGTDTVNGVEGASVGGGVFVVPLTGPSGDLSQSITLQRVNFYNEQTPDQVDLTIRDNKGHMSTAGVSYEEQQGDKTLYYRSLLMEVSNGRRVMYCTLPKGEFANNYGPFYDADTFPPNLSNKAEGVDKRLSPAKPWLDFTLTVPAGATAQAFTDLQNFYQPELECTGIDDNGDGTATHHFKSHAFQNYKASSLVYRVSAPGKVTVVGESAPGQSVDVSFNDEESPTDRPAYEDFNYYDSVLLNISRDNFMQMEQGDTFRLRSYRVWSVVSDVVSNVGMEPDFHWEVLQGADLLNITPVEKGNGNAKNNWLDLTASSDKTGVAIINITYDALHFKTRSVANPDDTLFGATDPTRSGLAVIQVGGTKANVDWGIAESHSDGFWDSEFDTAYTYGDTADFLFTPKRLDGGEIAEVALSTDRGTTWTALDAEEGTYTAKLICDNNLLRITGTDGATAYKLIRAAHVDLKVIKVKGDPHYSDVQVGDTIKIGFDGLRVAVPKLGGIYNPGFAGQYLVFTDKEGNKLWGGEAQFAFPDPQSHGIELTVTEDMLDEEGRIKLTDGYHFLSTIGSSSMFVKQGFSHRTITNGGVGMNGGVVNASGTSADFSSFPDIELTVDSMKYYDITFAGVPEGGSVTVLDNNNTTWEPTAENALVFSLPYGEYRYIANASGKQPARGTFTVSAADGEGSRTITVSMVTIEPGGWDGTTLIEPVKVNAEESTIEGGPFEGMEGYYKITGPEELAWVAYRPELAQDWQDTLDDATRAYISETKTITFDLGFETGTIWDLLFEYCIDGGASYEEYLGLTAMIVEEGIVNSLPDSLTEEQYDALLQAYQVSDDPVEISFVLCNDIDLSNFEWTPIGKARPATGVYEGAGHTVKNIYCAEHTDYAGLFGRAQNATFNDFVVQGYLTGAANMGGILAQVVREQDAQFNSITSSVDIAIGSNADWSDTAKAGGVVGDGAQGTDLFDCTFDGTIFACPVKEKEIFVEGGWSVGGIAGYAGTQYGNPQTISRCVNNGTIDIFGYAGGIVGTTGQPGDTMYYLDCINRGSISGKTVGGIVAKAENGSQFERCVNFGDLSDGKIDTSTTAGGIAGTMSARSVSQCFNVGTVQADRAGGIVGSVSYKTFWNISDCYNKGVVLGDEIAGGIVGNLGERLWSLSDYRLLGLVSNVYNTGNVSGETAGAIVGRDYANENRHAIVNAYYLKGCAPQIVGETLCDAAIYKVRSKTSDELKLITPLLGDAFKRSPDDELNQGYPLLIWQESPPVILNTELGDFEPGESISVEMKVSEEDADVWLRDNQNSRGLLFNKNKIYGTVNKVPGRYSIILTSKNDSGTTYNYIYYNVVAAPWISTETLPVAFAHQEYSTKLIASGYPTPSWVLAGSNPLPPGLSMDEYGVVTGVPTQIGTHEFVVIAINNRGISEPQRVSLTIKPADLSGATITTIPDQTWTGEALEPEVSVELNETTLVLDVDYTVSYENNSEVGTATVTITGIGNHTGTISSTFEIVNPQDKTWTRLAGEGRVETAAKLVAAGYPDECDAVIVTTAWKDADALAASGLSGVLQAPVITTDAEALSDAAKDEIVRLGATTAYILGSEGSVSRAVEQDLTDAGITQILRLAGEDRFATGMAIYEQGRDLWGDTCIVTKGWVSADTLAVGPYAYANKAPIFLADEEGKLSDEALAVVQTFEHVIVLGGAESKGALSDDYLTTLNDSVMRLSGSDRLATSVAIAQWATGELTTALFQPHVVLSWDNLSVAHAWGSADALAGVDLAGPGQTVLLLVDDDETSASIGAIKDHADLIVSGYVLGGPSSVSEATKTACEVAAQKL